MMTIPDYPKQVTGIVVKRFGSWRDVGIGTLPLRSLAAHEVLIKCEAAALNFQDLLMIEGTYQFKPDAPFIPGSDVAGTIVAVGSDVKHLCTGQRIAALVQIGAFADYSIGRLGRCFPIPENVDFSRAAASASIFATVVFALTIRGRLCAGERILITGAAGGVGIAAIQYARRIGADVIALVSSENKEQVARKAGAAHVLRLDQLGDPKEHLRTALAKVGIDGVDVVADIVSGDVFDGAIRCLRPGGRIIVIGFASGRIAQILTNYVLLKGIAVVGSALKFAFEHHAWQLAELMSQVYKDIESGGMDPFITATHPFEEFQQAAAKISERNAVGKIVLVPRAAN